MNCSTAGGFPICVNPRVHRQGASRNLPVVSTVPRAFQEEASEADFEEFSSVAGDL